MSRLRVNGPNVPSDWHGQKSECQDNIVKRTEFCGVHRNRVFMEMADTTHPQRGASAGSKHARPVQSPDWTNH
jgi:hypothetical protein